MICPAILAAARVELSESGGRFVICAPSRLADDPRVGDDVLCS